MENRDEKMSAQREPFYRPEEHMATLHVMLQMLNQRRDMIDERTQASWDYMRDERNDWRTQPIELNFWSFFLCQTYGNAAFSHTAAAGLAALFEGMFRHEFGMFEIIDSDRTIPKVLDHPRSTLVPRSFWNPAKHVDRKGVVARTPNVQRGARQILESLGIIDQFPTDFVLVTDLLFQYRNSALHNGYEWMVGKRRTFIKMIKERKVESWFVMSESGWHPWLILMSDSFIQRCFDVAVQTNRQLKVSGAKFKGEEFNPYPLAPYWFNDVGPLYPEILDGCQKTRAFTSLRNSSD